MTFVKQELTCINRSWYLRPAWLIFFAWVYGTVQCLPIFYTSNFIPLDYNNSTIYYCSTTHGQSLAEYKSDIDQESQTFCDCRGYIQSHNHKCQVAGKVQEESSSRLGDCSCLFCRLLVAFRCLLWATGAASQGISKRYGSGESHNLWTGHIKLSL